MSKTINIGGCLIDLKRLEACCQGCVAKADSSDKTYGLPLWMHLVDTAAVMNYIFDQRVSEQEKRSLRKKTNSDETTRKIFILLGAFHDIGKATAIFQGKLLNLLELENKFPLPILSEKEKYPEAHHAKTGMYILRLLKYSESFCSVCGAHHGKTQDKIRPGFEADMDIGDKRRPFFGSSTRVQIEQWKSIWKGISDVFLHACGFSSPEDIPELEPEQLIILTGYLSEADWLASNTGYFPLTNKADFCVDEVYPARVTEGIKKINFPEVWSNSRGEDGINFSKMFGFAQPRDFQKEVIDAACSAEEPGLMIIEAPMGSGKTEAALAAADEWSLKCGSGGVFVGLPTQATANGLLNRFRDWAEKESGCLPALFMLSHGSASTNLNFQAMPRKMASVNEDEENKEENLIVHEWMEQSRLRLFSDFVIGTIDQVLMAALNCRYVTLRHAGIAGKVLILDEIHAFDAYTNVYILGLLKWLGGENVPVILLSATLTQEKREEFISAYLQGKNRMKEVKGKKRASVNCGSLAYPRITWTDGLDVRSKEDIAWNETIKISITHLEIPMLEMDSSEELRCIKKLLTDRLSHGGCAGVVVNSVRKAQEISEYLDREMPDYKIITIHSGYRRMDREKIENQLLELVGKNSTPEQRNKLIVVGTQVIEQSLDIDFDFMISELAPIDLLFQRMGRLHRHSNRTGRPQKTKFPEFVVLDGTEGKFDSASQAIYGEYSLIQSRKVLIPEIILPTDIPVLIQKAYEEDEDGNQAKEKAMIKKSHKENKAEQWVLTPPRSFKRKQGINGLMKSQNIHDESQAQASVRDGNSSVEFAIFLADEINIEKLTPLAAHARMVRASHPNSEQFYQALDQCMKESEIPGNSFEVDKYEKVLILDEENCSRVGQWTVSYSKYGIKIQ